MLKGKLTLVTGSTSGIGLGIARALAAQGSDIVLNGFGEAAAIESLRSGIATEFGVRALFEPADLMDPIQTAALMARCDAHGGIDILVNNAGVQHTAPVETFPAERWDAIIALNLSSAFHTTRLALPGMRAKGWGRIINIASAHGLVASVEKSAYVAAKHGIIGLTKVVALETAKTGITCNAICPGWVLTPLVQKQIDARVAERGISVDEAKSALVGEKQPSMEFVTPEQLGGLASFLCSPAGAQVRGVAWAMDGGWTAQ
jgi:3-hydroxybutyrate dehydrogenase